MSVKQALLNFKQNINSNYDSKVLSERYTCLTKYYDGLLRLISDFCPDCSRALEITHSYSPISQQIVADEKYVLSDDDFTSLLAYHNNPELQVYNLPFNSVGFEAFDKNEKFSLIISDFGLYYSDIFDLMRYIMPMLECGGFFIAVVPSYWFLHNNLNEDESQILQYSKTTDKKWIFQDNIDFTAEDNGGKVEQVVRLDAVRSFSRSEAAKLAGLTKLYNAECSGDISVLDTVTVPQALSLIPAAVVIRKEKKTLDKNNLFNI